MQNLLHLFCTDNFQYQVFISIKRGYEPLNDSRLTLSRHWGSNCTRGSNSTGMNLAHGISHLCSLVGKGTDSAGVPKSSTNDTVSVWLILSPSVSFADWSMAETN